MSRPRAPLLALVLALAAVSLAAPGAAVGPVGSTAVDAPALTATAALETPTLATTGALGTPTLTTATATSTDVVGTETVDDATDAVNDTVDDTTDAVNDTADAVEDTTDGTTDAVNDTVGDATDDTTSSLEGTAGSLAGDATTDTALSVDAVLDPGSTLATASTADVARTGSASASAPADSTTGPASRLDALPGARGDLPVDGPFDPLAGAAVLGGAVAVTGLASRNLLTGRVALVRMGRAARLSLGRMAGDLRDRLDPVLGPFGYQRYDDTSPLDHDGRRRLAEAVRAEPGVHLSALGEDAGLPLSTARYHLRILEHEGLLRGVKLHGKRRFFPPDVEAEALAAALADDATERVLRSLVREGPASVSDLADRLDRDPSTVSHHLDRLADDGLVERERAGRAVVSSATAEVERAVERLRTDGRVAEARPVATH